MLADSYLNIYIYSRVVVLEKPPREAGHIFGAYKRRNVQRSHLSIVINVINTMNMSNAFLS